MPSVLPKATLLNQEAGITGMSLGEAAGSPFLGKDDLKRMWCGSKIKNTHQRTLKQLTWFDGKMGSTQRESFRPF